MTRCPACHRRLIGGTCDEHGAPPTAPVLPVAPPPSIPGWRLGDELGAGGSARVYPAWPANAPDGPAPAVLKVAMAAERGARACFAREAALLTRVGAPWGPRLLAAGELDGRPYLALERLPGETLAARLGRGRPSVDEACALIAAVGRALAGLHARGVVHLDLKPENVLVADGVARLCDLGLARTVDEPGGALGGTSHYAAPEQVSGGSVGAAADVYALAALGHELLAGTPPFVGDAGAIAWGHRLCRPPSLAGRAPAPLVAVVTAGLAKAPAARPALAALVEAAVASSAAGWPSSPPGRGLAPACAPGRGRGPAALVWLTARDRVEAARRAEAQGARVVRERVDGVVLAFLAVEHARPLAAARAVAERLVGDGAATVHVAEVTVGGHGGRRTIRGEAVERPEAWRVDRPGVNLTDEARRHQPLGAARPPTRSRLADVLAADLARALAGAGPRLLVVEGPAGSGRSTACAAVAAAARARGATVIALAARPAFDGVAATGAQLDAALAGYPGLTWLDRLQVAAGRGVVVVVDDGHRLDDEVRARLAIAAGWTDGALAVVVAGDAGGPGWSCPVVHHALSPLTDDEAHAWLRALLAPVERVPAPLVARLAAPAAGNPAALVAVADDLRRAGAIRRFPGADAWFLADDADELAPALDERARAARVVAGLPSPLARFVELCAALAPGGADDELAAVAAAIADGDEVLVDPGAGLAWLLEAGLAVATDGGPRLPPALAAAVAAAVEPGRRRAIHQAALAHWRARADEGPAALAARAHHARCLGEHAEAADAYLALASAARRALAPVEAVRLATLAIEAAAGRAPAVEALARVERGLARRPLTHYEAARADFAAALALTDDPVVVVRARLGDGEVCDFTDRLVESAQAIERAAVEAPAELPPALVARLDNWLGVVRARQGRAAEARAHLERARALAVVLGEHEVATGSALMLASLRRRAGDPDGAIALLDAVVARCRAAGDVFHLTVALFNRMNAARDRGLAARAEADCALAVATCARHGYGQMEIAGWTNLAALRLEQGRRAAAHAAARAAHAAARRRFGRPTLVPTLHLAALALAGGHRRQARALLAEIDADDAGAATMTRALHQAIVAAVARRLTTAAVAGLAVAAPEVADLIRALPVSDPSTPACACRGTRRCPRPRRRGPAPCPAHPRGSAAPARARGRRSDRTRAGRARSPPGSSRPGRRPGPWSRPRAPPPAPPC